jgi:sortase A
MKKLSMILIIVGILVMLVPGVGYLYNNYEQNKLEREWEEMLNQAQADSQEDASDNYLNLDDTFSQLEPDTTEPEINQDEDSQNEQTQDTQQETQNEETTQASGNETQAGTQDTTTVAKKPLDISKYEILGKIYIERIDKNLYIVEGVTEEDLRMGTGHIPGTAAPGQAGNCAIAGHRNYTFGKYWNRLDEVEVGDKVVITTPNGKYTYTVYNILIVEPTDTSVLEPDGDRKLLTLITCDPVVIATHRLIVQAEME